MIEDLSLLTVLCTDKTGTLTCGYPLTRRSTRRLHTQRVSVGCRPKAPAPRPLKALEPSVGTMRTSLTSMLRSDYLRCECGWAGFR